MNAASQARQAALHANAACSCITLDRDVPAMTPDTKIIPHRHFGMSDLVQKHATQ